MSHRATRGSQQLPDRLFQGWSRLCRDDLQKPKRLAGTTIAGEGADVTEATDEYSAVGSEAALASPMRPELRKWNLPKAC